MGGNEWILTVGASSLLERSCAVIWKRVLSCSAAKEGSSMTGKHNKSKLGQLDSFVPPFRFFRPCCSKSTSVYDDDAVE